MTDNDYGDRFTVNHGDMVMVKEGDGPTLGELLGQQQKYPCPDFLSESVPQDKYLRWLSRKASAHFKRDRTKGNRNATRESYKKAIHHAVKTSDGLDHYTGEKLEWDLISKHDNIESSRNGRTYKASFALLPTVDHVGNGLGPADFRIFAWRTNDAKNDLTHDQFVELCRRVVSHFEHLPSKALGSTP